MNYKRLISAAIFVIFILINVISGPGCANIIPPQGGPKDSLPPVLLKAIPVILPEILKAIKSPFI